MAGPELPEIPAPLKSIQPYLKTANEHDQRDVVVSYWCRLFALQTGLKLSTKTTEETNFLTKLMDWLEVIKKANTDNEAITNNVAAQAHIENWALKLFLYADKNDRASNFGKNVVQSFYTAGLLYDVLTTIGDLSDEAIQNRKYAKWKAAYIHNCLKNGQLPKPGPVNDNEDNSNENVNDSADNEDNEDDENNENNENNEESDPEKPSVQPTLPTVPYPTMPMQPMIPMQPTPPTMGAFDFPSVPAEKEDNPGDENNEGTEPHPYNPAPTPTNPGANNRISYEDKTSTIASEGGIELTVEQSGKAQKYIKWAGSALNYDDVPTAVSNLRKALHLLTTGEDPV